ncbi:hypothetical protein [Paenisporosarcina sp. NPDC076898]|uniref:hypothetical protein n=1 Tax=unclassified Paenisporosarcina TaxID=2642018 RepID=UPI003D0223E3
MTNRYLIKVKDKSNLEEITNLGSLTHVAKLTNIITLESSIDISNDLIKVANVVSVIEAEYMVLA